MAAKKTERVSVWLTAEQVAWLKTKGNSSETVRALVNEAMNIDRLVQSVRRGVRSRTSSKRLRSRSR